MRAIPRRAALAITALALMFVLGSVAPPSAYAWTFIVLHAFTDSPSDGAIPLAGLIMDKAGNLYGTTNNGGIGGIGGGVGTVFKLDPSGTESVLYSFKFPPDGHFTDAPVITDTAGNLYGTTAAGGSTVKLPECPPGCGTVFKLEPSGFESVLYSFKSSPDGFLPQAGLIMDTAGNLYGTTSSGGSGFPTPGCTGGCGTVFKLDPSGTETVLYSFKGPPDGTTPIAGLIRDAAGNLYGTAGGGTGACLGGCGTVFKLDPSGTESVLYSFKGPPDGARPNSLIMDAAGNLYGTTSGGGDLTTVCPPGGIEVGCGTVFKLDPSGTESVLYSFKGPPDGAGANSLIMDAAGNLYGTTSSGGDLTCPPGGGLGCGTVFKLDPAGTESVLYSFLGSTDGAFPNAVIVDKAGNLYGTAESGGSPGISEGCPQAGCGTVFELTPHTFAALMDLVKQFVRDRGAQNVMMTELKMAEADAEKGRQKAANRMLGVFIHQVSAVHLRRSLTSAQAASLVEVAKDLMT
jgi:uncharacterized repeat protein (TIGR03803 family)